MKRITALFSGIGEMYRILWQSGKFLTVLLVINNLIRNAFWPIRALVVKQLIDLAVLSWQDGFSAYRTSFCTNAVLLFLLFWANRIWWPLNSYTQALLLARIGHGIRLRIIAVMERIHLSFFDSAENLDTYERALKQVDGRQPVNAINSVMSFVSLMVSFLTAFSAMVAINVPVTAILLASTIPSIIWENRFNERVYQFDQEVTREKWMLDYLFGLFLDKTSVKELKIFRAEEHLVEKQEKVLKDYNRRYLQLAGLKFRVDSGFWLVLQIALMAGYYIIIADVANGRIAIGSLSFFLAVAVDIQESIRKFGSSFNGVIQSNMYFNNLTKLEEIGAEGEEPVNGCAIPEKIETIAFRHVCFSYPNAQKEALHDISFTLHCPQSVILVGQNGSGKSTLIKLLLGFYKPTSGEILINGTNIDRYNQEQYYSLYSVCFQDYMKYGFSFKDNIVLANPDMEQEHFRKIVEEAQLDDICGKLPEKEDTNLLREYDEKGVELSGGQYNRLAIARAMAKDAPIVLFDEPNAALDARAEDNLFAIYDRLTRDRLGIMITHRLQKAASMDMILVLKDGELVEQGKHQQLMEQGGEYAAMFHMQADRYGIM